MRTEEIKIFTFEELSESAQQYAIERWKLESNEFISNLNKAFN